MWLSSSFRRRLLVRRETSPEDIGGMVVSQGILTSTGGMTSHAAVVARGMGTPCVAGAKGVTVLAKEVLIGGQKFKEGDWITLNGTKGNVSVPPPVILKLMLLLLYNVRSERELMETLPCLMGCRPVMSLYHPVSRSQ